MSLTDQRTWISTQGRTCCPFCGDEIAGRVGTINVGTDGEYGLVIVPAHPECVTKAHGETERVESRTAQFIRDARSRRLNPRDKRR